uniref:40S ribosomal protein S8 n=1 Tax=Dicentrarchus labrax TaxID=13489 RepID=A0A8P4KER1_DICLA
LAADVGSVLDNGISRDNWHKRRKTGGKRKPYHKKRKYELGRPPANTKIGPRRIHTVRVRGGNKKYRALRLDVGNFSWGSECCTRKTRIIDVVYNASNNELVRTKTLVKNCIVIVDSLPYRQWYEAHYATPLGRKKGAKLSPEEEEVLNKDQHPLGGAVPAGKTARLHRLQTRPVRQGRRLHLGGQGARVLPEEDQGQERQIDVQLFDTSIKSKRPTTVCSRCFSFCLLVVMH